MIKIAVLGYGTVGSGVVEVITENSEVIGKRAGQPVAVKRVLDLREFPGTPVEHLMTKDYKDIINDEEISIVVEVLGGTEPAYTFVKQALLAGKSVCTSNKELVAAHGPELLALARDNSCNFLFEASVGGGIPIIRPMYASLTSEEIIEITGILNGTTNYILTKMAKEGLDFEPVLKEAQRLGYAERNPAADVEGHDACRKIAILSSLAYGNNVDYTEIKTEGITKITKRDMEYAHALNKEIKLLGTCKKTEKGVYSIVAPYMIDKEHPLATVNDVFNAIFVKGNMVDDVMFYGRGAGKLPTASAVVSDVVECAKNLGKNLPIQWNNKPFELMPIREVSASYFINVKVSAKEAAAATVSALFGSVSFVDLEDSEEELAFVTGIDTEGALMDKVKALKNEDTISSVKSVLRVMI